MNTAVLIPAYNPDENLISLVKELKERGFDILVINDGSPKVYDVIFSEVQNYALVSGYRENRGKGAALKYGIKKTLELFPNASYIITADCDGQHSATDICRVGEKLSDSSDFVLTTRDLRGKIPTRSRIGNSMSRVVYSLFNAKYLDDNQSGLRGFSVKHADWMLNVSGDKYDYEMNVLFYAAKLRIKICEMPIKTIYINENKSSHFKPVEDTIKIYKAVFKTSFATLFFSAVTLICVLLFDIFMSWNYFYITIPASCLVCAAFRFIINKLIVFKNINYRASFTSCLINIVRSALYTASCFLLSFLRLDMFVSFLISVVFFAAVQYYCFKLSYIIKRAVLRRRLRA